MIKKLILLLALLIVSCSDTGKTIEGEIVGHTEYDNVNTVQSIMGVSEGHYYTVKVSSVEYVMLFTGSRDDILEEGITGKFTLGEEMFSGTTEGYENNKLIHIKTTAYKLEEFKND